MIKRTVLPVLIVVCLSAIPYMACAVELHYYEELPENFYGTSNGVAVMNWSESALFTLRIGNSMDEPADYCITFKNVPANWGISAEPVVGIVEPKSYAEVVINLTSPPLNSGKGWAWITGKVKLEYPNSPPSEGYFPIIGIVRKSDDRPTVRLAAPGSRVCFEVKMKNTYSEKVHYDVYAEIATRSLGDTSTWLVSPSESSGYISAKSEKNLILNVSSPSSAPEEAWILVRLKVIDTYEIKSLYFLVVVKKVYSVKLECDDNHKLGIGGETVNYTLKIRNTGTMSDTYTITRSSPPGDWIVKIDREQASLHPSEEINFKVSIRIPDSAGNNETCSIKIRVQSVSKPEAKSEVTLICTANPPYYLRMSIDKNEKWTDPGRSIEFEIKLWNMGFLRDNISLYITPPPIEWSSELSQSNLSLGPSQYGIVVLSITPPENALPSAKCTVSVFAVSSGNDLIKASTEATVFVNHVHNMTIVADRYSIELEPGESRDVTVKFINGGNGVEGIDANVQSAPPQWKVSFEREHIEVAPYSEKSMKCTISVPYREKSMNRTVSLFFTNIWMKKYVNISVSVLPRYYVEIICIDKEHAVFPGMSTTYNLSAYNKGNTEDSIEFDVMNSNWNGWMARLSVKNATLGPGENTNLLLTVNAPTDAPAEQSYTCTVLAKSSSGKNASVDITTTAMGYTNFTLSSSENDVYGYPGDAVRTTLNIQNTGNREASVEIIASIPDNSWRVVAVNEVNVKMSEKESFECAIYIPYRCLSTIYNISIVGSAGNIERRVSIYVHVLPIHNISVNISKKYNAERNVPLNISVKIKNNGNVAEDVLVRIEGIASSLLKERKVIKRVEPYSEDDIALILTFPSYMEGGKYGLSLKVESGNFSRIYNIQINLAYRKETVNTGESLCIIQFSVGIIVAMLVFLIAAMRKFGYM